jgi:hypothetical protein
MNIGSIPDRPGYCKTWCITKMRGITNSKWMHEKVYGVAEKCACIFTITLLLIPWRNSYNDSF